MGFSCFQQKRVGIQDRAIQMVAKASSAGGKRERKKDGPRSQEVFNFNPPYTPYYPILGISTDIR